MSIGFFVAMSGWLADVAASVGNGRDETLTGIGLDDDTSVAEPSAPTPILTRWCMTPPMSSAAIVAPVPGVYPTLSAIRRCLQ